MMPGDALPCRLLPRSCSSIRTNCGPDVLDSAPEHFLSVTIDVALRMGVFGVKMTPRQIESHLNAAVDFFLNGVRRHDGRGKVFEPPGPHGQRRMSSIAQRA